MKTNDRLKALMQHKGDNDLENYNEGYNDNIIECSSEEYLVVTNDEADDLWEEELNDYINVCILPELPENFQNYFDEESWKSDARQDGRRHCLARYDGRENYEVVDNTTYFIYRIN